MLPQDLATTMNLFTDLMNIIKAGVLNRCVFKKFVQTSEHEVLFSTVKFIGSSLGRLYELREELKVNLIETKNDPFVEEIV